MLANKKNQPAIFTEREIKFWFVKNGMIFWMAQLDE